VWADGYGNRRVLIVDADTGKYIGHFGAYGSNPVDDAAARGWLLARRLCKGQQKADLLQESSALRQDCR
jgi:hypothetical protein